ncbi:hypothetical protein FOCG_18489 [Fusarium oxysporum f. sp. radicis-lycopersici 26381]|nr:hypothetical protein FOCG_18489 [Fusarium oxysporum f. sp. radicis-lycopersici 26381]
MSLRVLLRQMSRKGSFLISTGNKLKFVYLTRKKQRSSSRPRPVTRSSRPIRASISSIDLTGSIRPLRLGDLSAASFVS